MLKNLPIKLKLILLAGVPVIGALLLSYLVASDAQRRLESAEALGSIEDLARLAQTISDTVDSIQIERTATAYTLGKDGSPAKEVTAERRRVDEQVARLGAFFESRDTSALPERLAAGIRRAQETLAKRGEVRQSLEGDEVKLEVFSAFAEGINKDLIGATAELTSLSDDGVMLRNISGLVSVMELKERASRERALLAYVFAKSAYPPGGYKAMVNLVTEQEVFDQVLRQSTSPDLVELYDSLLKGKDIDRAAEIRQVGLDTMDDEFGIDPTEWLRVQGARVNVFRDLSKKLNQRVRDAALLRLKSAKEAVRTSFAVSGAVVLCSLILAIVISLGISRGVHALVSAASIVQLKQDFTVRAEKKSDDELGALTDAFNHMLDGIQKRDSELEHHRENLEKTVASRTAELGKRNEAMRLVLDNVEQGLATINVDGTLEAERSAAFNQWFEQAQREEHPLFADVLAANDNNMKGMLELGWEGLTDGFLPLDLAADQIPKKLVRDGRHYQLTYKPMGGADDFQGALLMVSDVTEEVERQKKESEQRELIAVFEAVMRDRAGFIEFFNDTERLARDVIGGHIRDDAVLRRVIHTIKGNSGIFGISSVADCCHDIETVCIDEERRPHPTELAKLEALWSSFAERVRLFADHGEENIIEVQYPELEKIIAAVESRQSHTKILDYLGALKHEPTEVRFARIGEQASRLAAKLGKEKLKVEIEGNHVRLPTDRWGEFWSSYIHVVRNAVDHGIENAEERALAGKSTFGTLKLMSRVEGADFVIEMSDDGRGVDWEKVTEKAEKLGLPTKSRIDLVNALFSDGLSTRDEASDTSGRGVGMSAMKDAVTAMQGTIAISSVAGRGTTVKVKIPMKGNDVPGPMSVRPGVRPSIGPPPRSVSGIPLSIQVR